MRFLLPQAGEKVSAFSEDFGGPNKLKGWGLPDKSFQPLVFQKHV